VKTVGTTTRLMRVLVVNAGSATLKLTIVGDDDHVGGSATLDPWDGSDPTATINSLLDDAGHIDAVGHRFVHGGPDLTHAVTVDDKIAAQIAELATLAPLHQARALTGLDAARRLLPDTPHVACFDTAFHATMPARARTYAVPSAWRQQWPVQRYGFHGLSHAWVARLAPVIGGRHHDGLRIVSCHLGAGASLCAIHGGRSIDTTMGFTPLDGLVMATRSGSVDPGLVLWLIRTAGVDPDAAAHALERQSGLAGLSGTSGDMRDVLVARAQGSPEASLAFDVYVHRLRREIAAMAGVLAGVDVLAFTGGVGEHSPVVRAAATATLGFLGVAIDEARNDDCVGDGDISRQGTPVATVVVSAREDVEIAHEVRAAIG
jgi:acetate kinase